MIGKAVFSSLTQEVEFFRIAPYFKPASLPVVRSNANGIVLAFGGFDRFNLGFDCCACLYQLTIVIPDRTTIGTANMFSDSPFFSIVIPTHNRAEMLGRAIDSILSSSWDDYEIIVVNDGSSDSYEDFKARYKDIIRYHENGESSGVASARNTGVAVAKGEWIVFLDDDDELAAGYLERIKETIGSYKDCCAVWGGVKIIQKVNNCIRVKERIFPDNYVDTKYLINDLVTIGVGFGFAINKAVFKDIGMFDESFRISEDTELFIRLVSNNYIPRPVPGIGVIKHEEHVERLSADFEIYSRENMYNRILEKHEREFLGKWRYNFIHVLMWSYRLHRQYGHKELEAKDLAKLVQLGIPKEHVDECYLSYSNLSDEYVK